MTPRVIEARGADERWYEVRLVPYKTTDHTITGVLMTLVPIDRLRAQPTGDADALAAAVVGELPHPALVVDPTLRVTWVNEASQRVLQRSERELVGRLLTNLGGPWGDARLRSHVERAVLEGTAFQDLPILDANDGATRTLFVSGSRVHGQPGDSASLGVPVLLVVTQDGRGKERARDQGA